MNNGFYARIIGFNQIARNTQRAEPGAGKNDVREAPRSEHVNATANVFDHFIKPRKRIARGVACFDG